MFLGSWKIDDNLTFVCNTHAAATGAATDADSVPSYRVYEDETGTAILTGSMAKLDDDNTTGFYSEQVALSAANGFEKGKCYHVYISATVSSVTGTLSHAFQIEAEVDANRVNWANVDNPTTTVGLSGTTIKTATDVETDTADIQSKIGSPAGASVSADIADIEGKVDDLESRLGTPSDLGSGATIAANLVDIESQTDNIPAILEDTGTTLPATLTTIEGKIDTVDGIVDDILLDTAEIGAAGAGLTEAGGTGDHLSAVPWNAAWDVEVQSEVQDAIEANHLDHLLAADYDPASKPGVETALLNELIESDGGISRFTANALEQALSGSGMGDWTSDEKEQIRYRLQLDGTQTAPAADAPEQLPSGIILETGLVQSAGVGNATLESGASSVNDYYNNSILVIIAGTGAGQARRIDDYTGSTRNCIIREQWKTTPAIDSKYIIVPGGSVTVGRLNAVDDLFIIESGYEYSNAVEYSIIGEIVKAVLAKTTESLNTYDPPTKAEMDLGFSALNDLSSAEAQAAAAAALTAYDPPTKAELDAAQAAIEAAITALNNLSAAEVAAAILNWWQTHSMPELTGEPGAEPSPEKALMALLMALRNASETETTGETTSKRRIRNDAGDVIAEAEMTEGLLIFNQGKLETP